MLLRFSLTGKAARHVWPLAGSWEKQSGSIVGEPACKEEILLIHDIIQQHLSMEISYHTEHLSAEEGFL